MVVNENALYNGHLWCAYDLKDEQGYYIENKRLFMRKESQQNKFICPDCGEHLILCAGPIMEPHFRHHEDSKCQGRERTGSGKFPEIRRQLYHLARRSFPAAQIDFQVKLAVGIVADIMIDLGSTENGATGKIVIEYAGQDGYLAAWEHKHQYYQDHKITDVWILSGFQRPLNTITTFEFLVSEASPILKILDTRDWTIYLKERCRIPKSTQHRLIVHPYSLNTLKLSTAGEFVCDFNRRCDEELNEILKNQEEQLRELKRRREEELEARRKQREERLERARKIQAARNAQSNRNAMSPHTTEKTAPLSITGDQAVNNFSVHTSSHLQNPPSGVQRRKAGQGELTKDTMKMSAFDEWWDLPPLEGADWQVRSGNMSRYRYLRSINKQAETLAEFERQDLAAKTLQMLEKLTQATQWRGR